MNVALADAELAFLTSHRAQSVASREFTRLSDALVIDAIALADRLEIGAPEVRLSPNRCIVQFGPVALTVAWLCNGTDLSEGELLTIVWQGVIPARLSQSPERAAIDRSSVPVVLSEELLTVRASSDSDWRWCLGDDDAGKDGEALAAHCVSRLDAAWRNTIPLPAANA